VAKGRPTAFIGVGRLDSASGTVLLDWARYLVTGNAEEISGSILNPPPPWGFPVNVIGAHAVLVLADGRHWECVVMSHDGRLSNRGAKGVHHPPSSK
jgi:hypothetical protein